MLKYRWSRQVLYTFQRMEKEPIFLLGNQKSGTTAICALLALRTGNTYSDYLRGFSQPILSAIQNKELSLEAAIRQRAKWEFSRKIIKECNLTLFYPQLKRLFPTSKKVFILRDPRDNIRSILNHLKLPANSDFNQLTNIPVKKEWQYIADNRWLSISAPTPVLSLALRWNKFAEICRSNRNEFLLIRYEDFVQDKIGSINWLAQQLHLPFQKDINEFLDHDFQPRGNHNISQHDFFGVTHLAAINEICAEHMTYFGYSK